MAMLAGQRAACRPQAAGVPRRVASPVIGRGRSSVKPVKAIELDLSDPDTQLSVAGLILGLVAGIGKLGSPTSPLQVLHAAAISH
jgi:hypothetical protein